MTYRSILLHLDESPGCARAREAAVSLSLTFDSHLTGLVLAVEPDPPSWINNPLVLSAFEALGPQIMEDARRLKEAQESLMRRPGLIADCRVERCYYRDRTERIILQARYSDLVVMVQEDPNQPGNGGSHLVEQVVLEAGRPVLVVPAASAAAPIGKRILVAWNASREATRAVTDALPLLKRAESVTLAMVAPGSDPRLHGEEPGADMAQYLARHDCEVEVRIPRRGAARTSEALAKAALEVGADMMVMGAYGHARLREVVLGGVTLDTFKNMTIPVLMSH